MTATAEHLSKTAIDTLCKKRQQMNHMEERFLEKCRPYMHDKPVTLLSIVVALGQQDEGRDKVAGFMTGKLMQPPRLQSVPCLQARAPRQNAHPPGKGAQLVVLGPNDACGRTVTSSRIVSATLSSNRRAIHYCRTASTDAGGKTSCL